MPRWCGPMRAWQVLSLRPEIFEEERMGNEVRYFDASLCTANRSAWVSSRGLHEVVVTASTLVLDLIVRSAMPRPMQRVSHAMCRSGSQCYVT